MRAYISILVITCVVVVAYRQGLASDFDAHQVIDSFNRDIKPLLSDYCYQCHGNGKKKGKVVLDSPIPADPSQWNITMWLSAIGQTSDGTMPPEEAAKQPSKEDRGKIVKWFTQAVNASDNLRPKDPGFVTLHRLNRTEYNNTIRDLTGIAFNPADDFPADDLGYGFDNIADVLTLSPLLTERYLDAADHIVDQLVKEAAGEPSAHAMSFNMAKTKGGVGKNGDSLTFYSDGEATFSLQVVPNAHYVLRVKAWQDMAGDEPARMLVTLDKKNIALADIEAVENFAQECSFRIKTERQDHLLHLAFVNDFYNEKAEPGRRDRNLHVDHVELFGPTDATVVPATKVFLCGSPATGRNIYKQESAIPQAEKSCAEQILRNFATRAFRRPVKDTEAEGLMRMFVSARKGFAFEKAVGVPLKAILTSPHFLFRVENSPATPVVATPANPSGAWELSGNELACRLSYFLWSTMPDDELMQAAQKSLNTAAGREEQIKRMLKDPRSRQLVENFAGQWLELRNLDEISRDGKKFPEYGHTMEESMKEEALRFFDSVVREDQSILTLVDADYTFVNDQLAKLYGIPVIKGADSDDFRRVSLKNTVRGGVITMGSTLTLTANPSRTSPVKRGKWVLEQILGMPPPPPPPEVPPLPEGAKAAQAASVRERLEKHRADPNCAACHARMDGIGFSLENFDSIGHWRDKDGTFPIDASGTLPGVPPFNGARELKSMVMKKQDMVMRNFIQKLMTYALGRGIRLYDRRAVNDIMKLAAKNNNSFSSVVIGIVNSDAFLKRREKRGDE